MGAVVGAGKLYAKIKRLEDQCRLLKREYDRVVMSRKYLQNMVSVLEARLDELRRIQVGGK